MAKAKSKLPNSKKKTSVGDGKFSKIPSKGGGPNGSTPSKFRTHKKPYRGQGKR